MFLRKSLWACKAYGSHFPVAFGVFSDMQRSKNRNTKLFQDFSLRKDCKSFSPSQVNKSFYCPVESEEGIYDTAVL